MSKKVRLSEKEIEVIKKVLKKYLVRELKFIFLVVEWILKKEEVILIYI